MPKFTVLITETIERHVEIEAHDADAARAWAHQALASEGTEAFEFGGVIERSIEVEEVT